MSIDTDVAVDTDVVALAARDVAMCNTAMGQILDRLGTDLGRLAPLWTGEAAAAFATAQSSWAASLRDMVTVLGLMASATGRSAQTYATAESNAQAYWA